MNLLPDYVTRMQAEHAELGDRITRLVAFLARPDIHDVVAPDQAALMRRQLQHMEGYLGVLSARLGPLLATP